MEPRSCLKKAHTFPQSTCGSSTLSKPTQCEIKALITQGQTSNDMADREDSISRLKQDASSPPRSPQAKRLHMWWLEIASAVVVVLALSAIISTAVVYDNAPNPNWPQGLSINSVFATYVVVLKAAFLTILATGLNHRRWNWFRKARPLGNLSTFGDASSGPLSSLWLLGTLYGRDILSCLGAFVIIAAIALEPMTQELIRYNNCFRTQDSRVAATIARTQSFSIDQRISEANISQGLAKAVNSGLYGTIVPTGFDCPTGNCEFPEMFYSLGYAHDCEDISNALLCTSPAEGPTTFSLASGLSASLSFPGSDGDYRFDLLVVGFDRKTAAVQIIAGQVPEQLVTPNCNTPRNINLTGIGYGAVTCTLKPVVIAVNASIAAGQLHERTTVATDVFGSDHFGGNCSARSTTRISCLNEGEIQSLTNMGYHISSDQQWLPTNQSSLCDTLSLGSMGITGTIEPLPVAPECLYEYYKDLHDFFESYFTGSISVVGYSDTGRQTGDWSSLASIFQDQDLNAIDGIFATIAASMTAYVRGHGDELTPPSAKGNVVQSLTCIHVRWGFLAYPASLAALTIAFLVTLVVQESFESSPIGISHALKSNTAVALLICGLEAKTLSKVEAISEVSGTDSAKFVKEVEQMPVSLTSTPNGWKFVAEEQPYIP